MAYVIIGASTGLGPALARRFARAGHSLVLVARSGEALETLAAELSRAHGIEAACVAADISQSPAYLDTVLEEARTLGGLEGVLFAAGASVRDTVGNDGDAFRNLVAVNFTAIAEAVNRLWADLAAAPGATVAAFGSVTAIRGRGRNVVYGAAKRALGAYFEGLRLAAEGTPVTVRFYVCGFLDSGNMKDERTPLPKGDPDRLADLVYRDCGKGSGVRYFPGFWRPAGWVLRMLPWWAYKRIAR